MNPIADAIDYIDLQLLIQLGNLMIASNKEERDEITKEMDIYESALLALQQIK